MTDFKAQNKQNQNEKQKSSGDAEAFRNSVSNPF